MHLIIDGRCEHLTFSQLYRWLEETPKRINMTPISEPFVREHEGNLTAFLFIAESALSVHWYKEQKVAHVDIFTCLAFSADPVIDYVKDSLNLILLTARVVERGLEYLPAGIYAPI